MLLARLLWERGRLLGRDTWTRERLAHHQARALNELRAFAYARSPFYRGFHAGLEDRPLSELPVLTKADLMAHFDSVMTDRAVRLADVEVHLAGGDAAKPFRGRYEVCATSGSTGRRGIFLFNPAEWTTVVASYARAQAWGGLAPSLTRPTRLAVVSTTTAWHQSARVGATVQSRWVPTLRLDATRPLPEIVDALNTFAPEVLVTYASSARALAGEQAAGRLRIRPRSVFSAAEVLTADTRHRVRDAWGAEPFDVYGATETATIAAECERHQGMHLFEDLVITEVVDEENQPVPPREYGAKVLVTVLFSRTLPLIRYEMSDSVCLSPTVCSCERPYRLLSGVQGRAEETLNLPAKTGGRMVAVHPNVFHDVLDLAPAAAWQVILEPDGLDVLLTGGAGGRGADEILISHLRAALEASGAAPPEIRVGHVADLERNATGKVPLIRKQGTTPSRPE
jgi:putative adenylate-forming enzyme